MVGVLEDINTTLTVLEHYVPKFFEGAKEVYWSEYAYSFNFLCHVILYCVLEEYTSFTVVLIHDCIFSDSIDIRVDSLLKNWVLTVRCGFSLISDEVQKFSKVNRNIYKPQVPETVKDIVRKNFTREMEFYEFCRRRLYMQYAALKLPQQEED